MNGGIAVDFGRGRLKNFRLHALGQAQQIDRADHAGLGRLHRIKLIMHRRGGTGEVVDFINLDIERKRHVVAHQLKAGVIHQMFDVAPRAGEEIIDAEHVIPAPQQSFAQVRPEKACAASN